ncbi:pyruvoyl-dependent arginine decarboxylase [Haloarcula nitratireducens]|uniref:arginine decarboxylase n=1 Tax=Haloarcula nitratireducens TaxID=2487749 RepID=A0AAW4PFF5_9EURY|nr:pyruvoyl-dependent arginine decarboxylase [Halomicroarcula nitratireducens]MBX0296358.1 pyruvoyl-dependent arginine decarboxylase [Halomicroarcula nitratireducens]
MSTIRVVWGTATGPTALSSYDAALAEAGVHNYNLVTLSSVIPAGPAIEVVGTAPDLGPPGEAIEVVQSAATAAPGERAAAGIGWARTADGPGIFYEVDGTDPDAVRAEIRDGLAAGRDLREWDFVEETVRVESVAPDDDYASAVVLATYGESRPVV